MPEQTCQKCRKPGYLGPPDHVASCIGHGQEQLVWCVPGVKLVWTSQGPVCEGCALQYKQTERPKAAAQPEPKAKRRRKR